MKHKGYIFNYVFDFEGLNYNSFQRGMVEGTNSKLIHWDGEKKPDPGSYVVIDSEVLLKEVKPSWELLSKKFSGAIYYVPESVE